MNKYDIYQHERFPGKWLVCAGQGGFGDTIHPTEQEAIEYATRSKRSEDEYADYLRKQEAEKKRKEEEDRIHYEWLNTYLKDTSPMKAGKMKSTLDKRVRYQGVVQSRLDLIECLVAKGGCGTGVSCGEQVLFTGDGCFLTSDSITKTGIDYAAWLRESLDNGTIAYQIEHFGYAPRNQEFEANHVT